MLLALLVLWPVMIVLRQMLIDKAFHGIYTTGGGLGTKMGIYVKETDCEQADQSPSGLCKGWGETGRCHPFSRTG